MIHAYKYLHVYVHVYTLIIFIYIYIYIDMYKNTTCIFFPDVGLCCRRNELGALRRNSDPGRASATSVWCAILLVKRPSDIFAGTNSISWDA